MALVLAAFLLWQLYVILLAYRSAPTFAGLLEGLGDSLPWATRAFFASYRYWLAVPALSVLLSIDVLRRESPHPAYFAATGATSLVAALALHAWLDMATLQPMFEIIEGLG